jgi:hypothetical protein
VPSPRGLAWPGGSPVSVTQKRRRGRPRRRRAAGPPSGWRGGRRARGIERLSGPYAVIVARSLRRSPGQQEAMSLRDPAAAKPREAQMETSSGTSALPCVQSTDIEEDIVALSRACATSSVIMTATTAVSATRRWLRCRRTRQHAGPDRRYGPPASTRPRLANRTPCHTRDNWLWRRILERPETPGPSW